jgi:hypothetical protein
MEIKGKVHCLFEQSGTFKQEFIKLGIPAEDYDIQNNFGQTDHIIDLFAQIETAYQGGVTLFDTITYDDLIVAFFPCIFFSQVNSVLFTYKDFNHREDSIKTKTDRILKRADDRNYYYKLLIKLVAICKERRLRLIVENPYSVFSYLLHNFTIQPSYIDTDRSRRGDYFTKPTMYYFVNCKTTDGFTWQKDKKVKTINSLTGHKGNLCDENRSLISSDYARNFICDNILGVTQKTATTQQNLFEEWS